MHLLGVLPGIPLLDHLINGLALAPVTSLHTQFLPSPTSSLPEKHNFYMGKPTIHGAFSIAMLNDHFLIDHDEVVFETSH